MPSYRKKHVKGKVRSIKPKKSLTKRSVFWICILVIIILGTIFYLLFFYQGLQVKNIIIYGNEKVDTEELRSFVSNDITKKIISFGNTNIFVKSTFLVNSKQLENAILSRFLLIEKVEISKNFFKTISLNVLERKPLSIFCSQDKCFLVDKNGIAFQESNSESMNFTIMKKDFDKSDLYIGSEVISKDIMHIFSEIQNDLAKKFNINIQEAFITSPIRMNIKTNENWQIYFNLQDNPDISSQLKGMNALLSGQLDSNNRQNLYYIDLRFKDRAVICDNVVCGG